MLCDPPELSADRPIISRERETSATRGIREPFLKSWTERAVIFPREVVTKALEMC